MEFGFMTPVLGHTFYVADSCSTGPDGVRLTIKMKNGDEHAVHIPWSNIAYSVESSHYALEQLTN